MEEQQHQQRLAITDAVHTDEAMAHSRQRDSQGESEHVFRMSGSPSFRHPHSSLRKFG
jgi:hypothetical protein